MQSYLRQTVIRIRLSGFFNTLIEFLNFIGLMPVGAQALNIIYSNCNSYNNASAFWILHLVTLHR